MNLDDDSITCFVLIDEMLPTVTKGKRLRERGPMPKLTDSEVITMEIVGTYVGLSQDQEVFDYFRRHDVHFSPMMSHLDRSTFVRQGAHLWAVKERLWCLIRDSLVRYDPTVAIVDSLPIPVCQFARAYRCHRFDDTACTGYEYSIKAIEKINEDYKNIEYIIVGSGPLDKKLKLLTKMIGLNNVIKFTGALNQNDLISCYSKKWGS